MINGTLRARMLISALALLALAGAAGAQIGHPPSAFVVALGVDAAGDDGTTLTTDGGVQLDLERRGRALYAVQGEVTLDEVTLLDMARVVAIATDLGAGIEAPVAAFLRERTPELAGLGPARVGVGPYRLALDVHGDAAPYVVRFRLELDEVEASAFPPSRHARGPADAAIVIREFSDFQCPFCKRFAEQVLPEIHELLLARGDVRFEYHHFPLRSIHAHATAAAEASECAADAAPGDDGAFWRFHDALFETQGTWANLNDPFDHFVGLAEGIELDAGAVAACLDQGLRRDTVELAYRSSVDLQLSGTPSVFVNGFKLENFGELDAYLTTIDLIEAFADDGAN